MKVFEQVRNWSTAVVEVWFWSIEGELRAGCRRIRRVLASHLQARDAGLGEVVTAAARGGERSIKR